MTSQVLGSLEPLTTANVDRDDRWSNRLEQFIHPDLGNRDRSWMGIPLMIRDKHNQYVLGVLTFTRMRKFERDTLAFSDRDLAAAENMAFLISLALYNKQRISKTTYSLHQILSVFMHEDMSRPMVDVRDIFARGISDIVAANRVLSAEQSSEVVANCRTIEGIMHFVLCGFDAYRQYIKYKESGKDLLRWDGAHRSAVGRMIATILDICGLGLENVRLDFQPIGPGDLNCRLDRSKTMFVIISLVKNAIKSCEKKFNFVSAPEGIVSVKAELTPPWLRIEVNDNGVGIEAAQLPFIYNEGHSQFESTGLGLAITKAFVECAVVDGKAGTIECDSRPGTGATFTVCLPVPE